MRDFFPAKRKQSHTSDPPTFLLSFTQGNYEYTQMHRLYWSYVFKEGSKKMHRVSSIGMRVNMAEFMLSVRSGKDGQHAESDFYGEGAGVHPKSIQKLNISSLTLFFQVWRSTSSNVHQLNRDENLHGSTVVESVSGDFEQTSLWNHVDIWRIFMTVIIVPVIIIALWPTDQEEAKTLKLKEFIKDISNLAFLRH